MSTWILILTLAYGSSQGGPALHSVPGFNSQAACMSAGAAWLVQMQVLNQKAVGSVQGNALCVEQPAPSPIPAPRKAPPA